GDPGDRTQGDDDQQRGRPHHQLQLQGVVPVGLVGRLPVRGPVAPGEEQGEADHRDDDDQHQHRGDDDQVALLAGDVARGVQQDGVATAQQHGQAGSRQEAAQGLGKGHRASIRAWRGCAAPHTVPPGAGGGDWTFCPIARRGFWCHPVRAGLCTRPWPCNLGRSDTFPPPATVAMTSIPVSSHTVSIHGQDASPHEVAPGEIAVGVVIGRASEYFDFFVYGIASALVFPKVFFPFAEPLQATLYSFAIFALAFISRPLGTALFLRIQARWSRGTKMTAALFLLGTATAGIAFLPGYARLGATAIVLLALFRLAQGVALGGSWDGLPSLLALNAPKHRRGWYAMLGQLGAPVGFIVAAALFAFLLGNLPAEDFYAWGWRYPFFAAFAINVVALFARLRLVVTHEYERQMGQR